MDNANRQIFRNFSRHNSFISERKNGGGLFPARRFSEKFFSFLPSNLLYLFGLTKNYFGPRVPRLRIGRLDRIAEEVSR